MRNDELMEQITWGDQKWPSISSALKGRPRPTYKTEAEAVPVTAPEKPEPAAVESVPAQTRVFGDFGPAIQKAIERAANRPPTPPTALDHKERRIREREERMGIFREHKVESTDYSVWLEKIDVPFDSDDVVFETVLDEEFSIPSGFEVPRGVFNVGVGGPHYRAQQNIRIEGDELDLVAALHPLSKERVEDDELRTIRRQIRQAAEADERARLAAIEAAKPKPVEPKRTPRVAGDPASRLGFTLGHEDENGVKLAQFWCWHAFRLHSTTVIGSVSVLANSEYHTNLALALFSPQGEMLWHANIDLQAHRKHRFDQVELPANDYLLVWRGPNGLQCGGSYKVENCGLFEGEKLPAHPKLDDLVANPKQTIDVDWQTKVRCGVPVFRFTAD